MIEHAHPAAQLLKNDLYDLNSVHLATRYLFNNNNNITQSNDLQNTSKTLKSASSHHSSRLNNNNNNNKYLDKKLAVSDESLALSITAAVAELRPCPEILPFSVDLPIKCKFMPLVRQSSAPASVNEPLIAEKTDEDSKNSKSYSKIVNCTSADSSTEEKLTSKLFEIDCNSNKDLINDFFLTDHYLMSENKNSQKKQSTEIIMHTRNECQWVDWNDGMCEWYPSNPYPPFKNYIKSFRQARIKQQNLCDFDTDLGLYLPRKQLTQLLPANTNPKAATVNTTNNKPPISHFLVPTNVANRLERQRRHEEKENDFASVPIIYPFMESGNVQHQQISIIGSQHITRPPNRSQRQYSANNKSNLKNHTSSYQPSPFTSPEISTLNNQVTHLDSPSLNMSEFKNQAESMLYSNATRMLQLRSKELDKVKDDNQFVFNYKPKSNEFQSIHNNKPEQASYTPPPPMPPPPPPYKQEHLSSTQFSKLKPPVIRSYTTDNDQSSSKQQRMAYHEIEAFRIKSYNEGANIFKINKIREFTPEQEKRMHLTMHPQQEFLKQKTLIKEEQTNLQVNRDNNIDISSNKLKTSMENTGAGQNTSNIPTERTIRVETLNSCDHTTENCRCVTELQNKMIKMSDKLNENAGYINYQLGRNPNQKNYQSMTYSSQQSTKSKKSSADQQLNHQSSTTSNTSPNPSLSVYNPFLIASSRPLSLTTKFDTNSFLANLQSTAPASSKPPKEISNNNTNNTANTSSQQTTESPILTSLPPIISGKRIKLPLGPHSLSRHVLKMAKRKKRMLQLNEET